jgi:hypothetical protein
MMQCIATVLSCVREHETNCRWLMELIGQIQNVVNKRTDSDNQQVRTATVIPTQQMQSASFKFSGIKTLS